MPSRRRAKRAPPNSSLRPLPPTAAFVSALLQLSLACCWFNRPHSNMPAPTLPSETLQAILHHALAESRQPSFERQRTRTVFSQVCRHWYRIAKEPEGGAMEVLAVGTAPMAGRLARAIKQGHRAQPRRLLLESMEDDLATGRGLDLASLLHRCPELQSLELRLDGRSLGHANDHLRARAGRDAYFGSFFGTNLQVALSSLSHLRSFRLESLGNAEMRAETLIQILSSWPALERFEMPTFPRHIAGSRNVWSGTEPPNPPPAPPSGLLVLELQASTLASLRLFCQLVAASRSTLKTIRIGKLPGSYRMGKEVLLSTLQSVAPHLVELELDDSAQTSKGGTACKSFNKLFLSAPLLRRCTVATAATSFEDLVQTLLTSPHLEHITIRLLHSVHTLLPTSPFTQLVRLAPALISFTVTRPASLYTPHFIEFGTPEGQAALQAAAESAGVALRLP